MLGDTVLDKELLSVVLPELLTVKEADFDGERVRDDESEVVTEPLMVSVDERTIDNDTESDGDGERDFVRVQD